jgi:hypothetical protein
MIANKKLVFVVGPARSGTTWLQRLLAQSPNAATAHETHLFSNYLRSPPESWRRHEGGWTGLHHLISEDELLEWMRGFAELCLGRIADARPDVRMILEKTPKHGEHVADILRLFPDAFFIHIIRDPRAVVPSLRAASRSWGSTWAPGRLKEACAYWEDRVTRGRAIATMTPRYREISYERLHADGADQIAALFAWLKEPISDEEAAGYVAACAFDKMRRPVTSTEEADKLFYRRGGVDSWRRELSGSDIAIIERLTRKQMAALGYEPVAGSRDRAIAAVRLGAYVAANKFAKAVRAGADRIKP